MAVPACCRTARRGAVPTGRQSGRSTSANDPPAHVHVLFYNFSLDDPKATSSAPVSKLDVTCCPRLGEGSGVPNAVAVPSLTT